MTLLHRILKSVQDGSFAFKILNRISPVKYVPGPEKEINEYLIKNYPTGKAWQTLSPAGRKIWIQFHRLFDHYDIQTIAYVGANEGFTVLALNEAFTGREFFLFEPVPQTFDVLIENTRHCNNLHCFNIAAGAKEEERQMLVDEYSQASSLLVYKPVALEEYPFLGKQSHVNVQVRPLDQVMKENKIDTTDLLLMDVQGFENEVLLGAQQTLKTCKIVISEMSLQPLYRDTATFDSVYQALVRHGFQLQNLINPMQGESRQTLQIDGIFVRDGHE